MALRTAEEIYNEATLKEIGNNPNGTRMDIIIVAINIAREELLYEVAKRATATVVCSHRENDREAIVNKQSILSLLKENK